MAPKITNSQSKAGHEGPPKKAKQAMKEEVADVPPAAAAAAQVVASAFKYEPEGEQPPSAAKAASVAAAAVLDGIHPQHSMEVIAMAANAAAAAAAAEAVCRSSGVTAEQVMMAVAATADTGPPLAQDDRIPSTPPVAIRPVVPPAPPAPDNDDHSDDDDYIKSSMDCAMAEPWSCERKAIRGGDGWIYSRKIKWRKCCKPCKHMINEQQAAASAAANGGDAEWPDSD